MLRRWPNTSPRLHTLNPCLFLLGCANPLISALRFFEISAASYGRTYRTTHSFLSFSFKDPNLTVYSADFAITTSSYLFPADIKLGNKTTTSYSNKTSLVPSPTAATDKDRTSTKNVTTSSPVSEHPTATAPRSDHTQPGNNVSHTNIDSNLRKGAGMKIDLELHQFMVVVLCHAMIGIFMAI